MTNALPPARVTALAEACAGDIDDQAHERLLSDTVYKPGTAATLIAAAITAALAEQAAASVDLRLLSWIYNKCVHQGQYTRLWYCLECHKQMGYFHAKLDVRHALGCVLHGWGRATLEQLDKFEIDQTVPL